MGTIFFVDLLAPSVNHVEIHFQVILLTVVMPPGVPARCNVEQ